MEKGTVDIIRRDACEGAVCGAGADRGGPAGPDGSGVFDVLARSYREAAKHGLAEGKGTHLIKIGADAGDAAGVVELAVGAPLPLGVHEEHKGGGDANGQATEVNKGESRVFAKKAQGRFERVHSGLKLRIFNRS